MTTRTAACACGQLNVTCDGEPNIVSLCHCFECQKRTGSLFGVAAWYSSAHVRATGAASTYRRAGDSGKEIAFHFCPTCGTTLYWSSERRPDFTAVAVGAFADPKFGEPRRMVYTSRKHEWLPLPAEDRIPPG